MTAAALSQSPEPYEVPEGGLASFLTATVGDWSDEAINSDNYYDIVKPTADQLAAFGREEDDRIAHVATGETVIPMAVFEEDPALKEALFARMRDMGIEPERYVVGNELNSINPVTGQPEFFLKKIFKGIKKAVKGVVKVFKKIAPIVLSIGLAMTPLGPIVGAALGSGLGTLIQGGDLKDAFKSALIGGAMGGLSSGIGSVLKGGEFMAGVKSGLPTTFGGGVNPTLPSVQELASKVTEGTPVVDKTLAEQVVSEAAAVPPAAPTGAPGTINTTGPVNLLPGPVPGAAEAELAMRAKTAAGGLPQGATMAGYQGTPLADDAVSSALGLKPAVAKETVMSASPATGTVSLEGTGSSAPGGINASSVAASSVQQTADRTFLQKVSDYMFRAGQSPAEVNAAMASAKADTIRETLASLKAQGITGQVAQQAALKAGEQAAQAAAPGILAKYGPLAAAGLGILGLTGGFEQPEMEPIEDMFGGLTGMDLIRQNPDKYSVGVPFQYPPPGAANGGDIQHFPRKNGAIYGPGTETSDDIPAMLSDGEFVMTAKAVRGAGNGSREAGMRRMYDMMRKFEGGAARGY